MAFRSHVSRTFYSEMFGWDASEGPAFPGRGSPVQLAWAPGGKVVGSIWGLHRPEVHPQWVFHFVVPNLDTALKTVRASGGVVLQTLELPIGERLAVCDDAQGAGFGLRQPIK